jgi:hypothetical protein
MKRKEGGEGSSKHRMSDGGWRKGASQLSSETNGLNTTAWWLVLKAMVASLLK